MLCDGCEELVSDPIQTPWGLLCAGCQVMAMEDIEAFQREAELSEQEEAEEKARMDHENHQEA